ncbi:LEA type 2 family protein [Pelagibius litoralis]|uniref:LEA type 2 family protein n=1 Tax=Pelagibius litoralis TaxID=374515 RepID=A0A967EVT6_9PROT|nr:LEA type 2 family protein [Pelagibius litoralis]NIA69171.1 LEA type 2 family protein [Pelagibius litoralis]
MIGGIARLGKQATVRLRGATLAVVPLLLVFLAGCASTAPIPPQVRITDLRLLDSGVFEQRFQIDIRIGNPNDFALPLDGLTFDLDVNGANFARGFSNETVTVPRLGEAGLSVIASTTFVDLVQQMLLLAERGDLTYRVHGIAYLDSLARRQAPYESIGTFRLSREQQIRAEQR